MTENGMIWVSVGILVMMWATGVLTGIVMTVATQNFIRQTYSSQYKVINTDKYEDSVQNS